MFLWSYPAPGSIVQFLGALVVAVRDIHEAYRMNGDMICGTYIVHMGSTEREEAKPRATSCI